MGPLFRLIITRSLAALLTLLGALILLFLLIQSVPGDPVTILLGPRATPELRAQFVAEMGLDRPVWEQLWLFLSRVASGDLGTDIITKRPIADLLIEALPNTLQLAGVGLVLALTFGVALGIIAARHPGSRTDTVLGVLSVAFITTPGFVVAIFLLLVFAVGFGWFPVTGAGEGAGRLHHIVLPAVALSIGWVGYIARLVRASLLEIMTENHVRMMRAYGVSEGRIVRRYALRLALIPLVSVMGIGIGDMIANAIFVEVVFARPGIGTLIYTAITTRNFPVVQAGILFTVTVYVLANLLVEIVNATLDPRIARSLGGAA